MSSQPAGFYGTYFANSGVGIHILQANYELENWKKWGGL
jgi:hypothetical protein